MHEKFEHKKSLGQHFLTSDTVPRWMCDAADLEEEETVFEIGPGSGVLTRELLGRSAHVIALEADPRAIETLKETFEPQLASGQLRLKYGDARELDLPALGLSDHTFTAVANIPYYLSGVLFRTLLESSVQPNTIVFLVQKEIAERICRDKKESLLSLSVKVYGTPRYVRTVSRGHFHPTPNVDSAIVAVSGISRSNFDDLDERFFFELLHLGFGSKRKQLLGNLSKRFDRSELLHMFSTLSIGETVRAEDLPLEKWLQLVKALFAHTKSDDSEQT